ncbi:hypothetical protein [Phytomonospora endophytica]|uniref:Uncharacterized protein n=1 Tax=Phytomonospora endophytica TaxID=714109 RepID=A0A841FJ75_9ACTN|nr:hypothetical protein [Phytomonospora endophytica]MBB6032699.1 hypothetical protein [Phytomonospora endophytica]GIG66152.1 hypothetical protein Pen01_24470 [Phytomonospora endophytica]
MSTPRPRRPGAADRARADWARDRAVVRVGPNRALIGGVLLIAPALGALHWLSTGLPHLFGLLTVVAAMVFALYGGPSPVLLIGPEDVWIRNYRRHRRHLAIDWEHLTLRTRRGPFRAMTFAIREPGTLTDIERRAVVPWLTRLSEKEILDAMRPHLETHGVQVDP